MKKLWLVAALGAAMAAPNVFAQMTVVLLDDQSQYSYGVGGEFRAVGNAALDSGIDFGAYSALTSGTISAGTDGSASGYNSGLNGETYFQTFCIQTTVEFSPGTTYNASAGDTIAIGTAWLYSQFASGALANHAYTESYNYAYGGGRTATAADLQNAIWWIQSNGAVGARNNFVVDAETALGLNDSQIVLDGNGAYGVASLDLSTITGGTAAQDQLVIVPEPTTVVAGALLLLPLGASTLRVLRRNRIA
jgi:hypothetical protein